MAEINSPPTVGQRIRTQTLTEDAAFNFTVPDNTFLELDPDDDLTLSATLRRDSPLPGWLSFNAAQGTFSGTPTNADVGRLRIRLTATDEQGASVSTSFVLRVNNVNDVPTVANPIPNLATEVGDSFSYTFDVNTFADVDAGDSLQYTGSLADGSSLPTWLQFNAGTQTFSGTPAAGDAGTLTIRLTATDRRGASVNDEFTLTIEGENVPPVVSMPIADRTATQGTAFGFTLPAGTFQDDDPGDVLSYSAQLQGGAPLPSWLRFNSRTQSFSGTPTAANVGALNITVIATDPDGATTSDTFTLTVQGVNAPPAIDNPIADRPATEDEAFTFVIPSNTFSDPEGETLTLTVNAPSWLTFDALTGTLSGTPTNDNVGAANITVTATDPQGASTPDTFTLTVVNVNDAPVLVNPLGSQTATEDQPFSFQVPEDTFEDVDPGDSLTYEAALLVGGDVIGPLPGWLSFDAATGTFNGTPTNTDVGTYTIVITATDEQGASVSEDLLLTVDNVNDAPTLDSPIGDQTDVINLSYSYQIPETAFSDVDTGDSLQLTVTLADGSPLPGWLSFDAATRTLSGTPSATDINPVGAMAFEFEVTATDTEGASASDTFILKVFDSFDPVQYGASYTDLIEIIGNEPDVLTEHYINFGRFEGRPTDLFNEFGYLVANPDVLSAFGIDPDAAATHYIQFGFEEGRDLGTFEPARYIAGYDDLVDNIGYDLVGGTAHYLNFGIAENRDLFSFDPANYLASSALTGGDLITFVNDVYGDTFGANYDCVTDFGSRHFIEFGKDEARSRGIFDAQTYLNDNADLQAAFGNDLAQATRHYIEYGFEEGRSFTVIM